MRLHLLKLKLLLVACLLTIIYACGRESCEAREGSCKPVAGPAGPVGASGKDGTNGTAGGAGRDGLSLVFTTTSETLQCAAGGSTLLLALDSNRNNEIDAGDTNFKSLTVCNGEDGTDGVDGEDGVAGQNGERGEDGDNGRDGTDGRDGADAPPTAFTPVTIINPCGDAVGVYDEVLLKLASGEILASFSENASGKNTRFSLITAGNYVTTDGDSCYFTITSGGQISNEHH